MSLPLLRHRVQTSEDRLKRSGLTPMLLTRQLGVARDSLAPVARVLPQLDPRRPLQRGYALIKSPTGSALTTKDAAQGHSHLVIEFRDGELGVQVEGAASSSGGGSVSPSAPEPDVEVPVKASARKPAKAPKTVRPSSEIPRQDDLFGS